MTRETRIGLLVGLAFIVMFGLVLSELTGTNEPAASPPQARLDEVMTEGWSPIISEPVEVEPADIIVSEAPVDREAMLGEATIVSSLVGPAPSPASEIVQTRMQDRQAIPAPAVAMAAPPQQTYTVAPGDSLAKIARTVYGPAHEGEYRRIFEANRGVLSDESIVQVGQELLIPPLEDAPQVAAASRQVRQAAPQPYREMDAEQLEAYFLAARDEPAAPARVVTQRAPSGRVYVVKSNDNLTKIARRLLNDGSRDAVMKIYNANRDKLSSPNVLPVGVELRIPG